VGIDLGSTTTKAIILDEHLRIVGRGITNSRSNYGVACHIAKSEAFVNARFSMLAKAIRSDPAFAEDADRFMHRLEQRFRYYQYMFQLKHLRKNALQFAQERRAEDPDAHWTDVVEEIFEEMEAEAPRLFAADQERRSDFFRDIAGASFQRKAEARCRRQPPCASDAIPFDALIGIYDKSILLVESVRENLGFAENIGPALTDVLAEEPPAIREKASEMVEKILETPIDDVVTIGTGYGRTRLPFAKEHIRSEILCHGLGAHYMFPRTATVLDIGGQDTKAIQVDSHGIVTNFQMNDRCAAGCGRYLGYIADEMNLGLHELGPLSLQAKRQIRINSTC
ncbi:MAG: benzoyl-CoA reductase subunit A, partial [Deltaproteobacteria bacterium]